MRRLGATLLAAVLLAGCATAGPPRPRPTAADATQTPRRCSPADPDRWAWFCVVGQVLYGAAAFFTPVNEVTMR
ncbi:MAG TPA: hypothetical protein VIG37_21425 [Methylomirabilota bacterium]|jgi:hypothetical protein